MTKKSEKFREKTEDINFIQKVCKILKLLLELLKLSAPKFFKLYLNMYQKLKSHETYKMIKK